MVQSAVRCQAVLYFSSSRAVLARVVPAHSPVLFCLPPPHPVMTQITPTVHSILFASPVDAVTLHPVPPQTTTALYFIKSLQRISTLLSYCIYHPTPPVRDFCRRHLTSDRLVTNQSISLPPFARCSAKSRFTRTTRTSGTGGGRSCGAVSCAPRYSTSAHCTRATRRCTPPSASARSASGRWARFGLVRFIWSIKTLHYKHKHSWIGAKANPYGCGYGKWIRRLGGADGNARGRPAE